MAQPNFYIYHASAGSGKTFTLVKFYLKRALQLPGNRSFRKLLALTFTNKAVNEMKLRILRSLVHFSESPIPKASLDLAKQLQEELKIDEEALRQRAKQLLKDILHNYAFFDISTIDRFNHRLIRTFSKDLGLPHSFEVILDEDALVEEAVDRLLERSGTSRELTDFLIAYTLQHVEDDRSWDIRRDLSERGQLLFQENHQVYINGLKSLEFEDLRTLERDLNREIARIDAAITAHALSIKNYLEQHALVPEYFYRKTFPNHIDKIIAGERHYRSLYDNKLSDSFESGRLFKASMPFPKEEHTLFLHAEYKSSRKLVMRFNFFRNVLNNVLPLTVLNSINLEIENLKKEKNWLPISAFNTLISEQIRDQPTPFIYERIGEIYRHFFLDEFQDTSVVQWQNLIPLISGALSSSGDGAIPGSLMLVGDAKQAIYRWRGGRAEQFLSLISQDQNPFFIEPELHALDTNYRSAAEIIRFNNSFFKSTSNMLQQEAFRDLFDSQAEQSFNAKKGGCVRLRFMDPSSDTLDEDYAQAVLQSIHEVRNKGYAYKDISILVRKKKHALLMAAALGAKGIPLISPESLLLQSNPGVQFLVHLLCYLNDPVDRSFRFEVLYHLAGDSKTKHDFIENHIGALEALLTSQYGFDPSQMRFLSLFDMCSQAIRQFKLDRYGASYLQYFLDAVLDQESSTSPDIGSFLEYWSTAKEKLGVPAPEDWDAIRIMTIHKSKGLEFPVVIYPYANTRIYAEIKPKIWVASEDPMFSGFDYLLLDKKKEMQDYSEAINETFMEEQHRLELDAFNVLYVAMTRAVEALYVFCNKGRIKRDTANSYNELFEDYLKAQKLWEDDRLQYEWGSLNEPGKKAIPLADQQIPFRYTFKDQTYFKTVVTSGLIWDPQIEKAQEYGEQVHQLLSKISYRDDVDHVLTAAVEKGELDTKSLERISQQIRKLADHPEIGHYFGSEYEIRNEQDILTHNGIILRPDRVMIRDGRAHIIDYKTGEHRNVYEEQIYTYAAVLGEMGYDVGEKILIYLSEEINIKYV